MVRIFAEMCLEASLSTQWRRNCSNNTNAPTWSWLPKTALKLSPSSHLRWLGVRTPCHAAVQNQSWREKLLWNGWVTCCAWRWQVVFSPSTLQKQDGDTEPCLTWRMEFHRGAEQEMLAARSSVVWHWEWLQLRLHCTLLTNKPHVPSRGMPRTTQRKNNGSKLNFCVFDTGWGLFLVVCAGVVLLSRSRRLSFLVLVLSSLHWLSTGFRRWLTTVTWRREGVRGSWGKSERKEFWQARSRLMGERSGFVNSARSHVCGRGGVAGDATTTSRQGCVGSTGRRSQ